MEEDEGEEGEKEREQRYGGDWSLFGGGEIKGNPGEKTKPTSAPGYKTLFYLLLAKGPLRSGQMGPRSDLDWRLSQEPLNLSCASQVVAPTFWFLSCFSVGGEFEEGHWGWGLSPQIIGK